MKKKGLHFFKGFVLVLLCNSLFTEHDNLKPNGSSGPSLCCNKVSSETNRLFLELGFFYAQAKVTGTEYAHTNETPTTWAPPAKGSVLFPKLDPNWGLVVGMGYYFKHDNWVERATFNGAKFSSTECSDCACVDEPYYVPDCIWCHDLFPPLLNHLDPAYTLEKPYVTFSVQYYMLEDLLSKGSFVSNNLSIEPSFGIKMAWLEFYEKVCFKDVQPYNNCCSRQEPAIQPYPGDLVRVAKSKFWGFGPRIGLESVWNLFQDSNQCLSLFNFFADFNAALLIGRTKSSDQLDLNKTAVINITNDYNMLSPVLRLVIGTLFNKSYSNNTQFLAARIGWDNSIYFNQFTTNCLRGICSMKTNENNTFSMSGLLVDIRYSF